MYLFPTHRNSFVILNILLINNPTHRMMVGVDTDQEMVKNMAERIILDSSPLSREITYDEFKMIMNDVTIQTQMSVKFHT